MLESNCSGGSCAAAFAVETEVGARADARPPSPWLGCGCSCWCRFIGIYLFARSNCMPVCARFLAFIQLQAGCQFVLQKDTQGPNKRRGSATERCTNCQLEMRWRISATPMAARHSYLAPLQCSFAFIVCLVLLRWLILRRPARPKIADGGMTWITKISNQPTGRESGKQEQKTKVYQQI